MRFSINVPNFGDFADAHTVARVAIAAEEAGWDGLFVWDHVVHSKERRRGRCSVIRGRRRPRPRWRRRGLKLGPLVTPVARRRPEQLARQVSTLDAMSGGRVIFGAGLGGPIPDEFGSFGDATDPRVLAEQLDEGLDLLAGTGPARPSPRRPTPGRRRDPAAGRSTTTAPVWIAGTGHMAPMRRAARWDGAVPLFRRPTTARPHRSKSARSGGVSPRSCAATGPAFDS